MPPAKKATRKPAKKTSAKKTAAKKTGAKKQSLSAAHKRALATGRTESSVVNQYLAALHVPKKRGRKVSAAQLGARLQAAEGRARTSIGVDRLLAHQEARDLRARLATAARHAEIDLESLERAFVKVAKKFGERRAIGYGSWRDAGVPAAVLKRAGVPRTRR